MEWQRISFSKDEVRKGELHKILKLFSDILEAYHGIRPANGIALFDSVEHNIHHVYFSPASAKIPAISDLIDIYDGLICKTPFKGSLNYLAGDVDFAKDYL